MLNILKAPTQPTLNLDTRLHINATDGAGKLLFDDLGKPITIARDLATGNYYQRIADAFPFHPLNAVNRARVQEMADAGAVHVAHDDERWRGVWVPMTISGRTKAPTALLAESSQRALPEPNQDAGEAPRTTTPKKRAAKKSAKRAA